MNAAFILVAFLATIGAIVIDWQREKSSFLGAAKAHAAKYIIMFIVGGFFATYVLQYTLVRVLLVVAGVYYVLTFIGSFAPAKKSE